MRPLGGLYRKERGREQSFIPFCSRADNDVIFQKVWVYFYSWGSRRISFLKGAISPIFGGTDLI